MVNFKGILRQYQLETIEFMKHKPAIFMCHDMGLGKTIITLYYCELTKEQNPSKILILCPSQVINTWKEEIEKWTNTNYVIIEGTSKQRRELWKKDVYYYITNYEKLRTDTELFQKKWGIIVADECTKLKSISSQLTQQASKLKSFKRIALSGFPIHNSPIDLYSIISFFVFPYYFGKYPQFKNKYVETELVEMGDKVFSKVIGYKNLNDLKKRISPFFIRKTKQEVLPELPPLIFETLSVGMTSNQKQIYDTIMADINDEEPELNLLTALKLLSNHPQLLKETEGNTIKKYGNMVVDLKSNKLDTLLEFLEEQTKENKIVIFSQYTGMLDIISNHIKILHTFIRGDTPKAWNDKNIEIFKTDSTAKVLLSSDSGAFGINLQEASIIIHYDLPFNPAIYKQRIDRLYRIGQTKGVVCINFVTNSTIEHRVLQILLNKVNMIDQVIEGTIEKDFLKQIFETIKNGNSN